MTNYSDFDCPDTYLDGKEFKKYQALVEITFRRSHPVPLSIAALHRTLGDKAIPKWTCDAIDHIELNEVSILPSRYVLRETLKANGTKYRDLMAVIFPKQKRL